MQIAKALVDLGTAILDGSPGGIATAVATVGTTIAEAVGEGGETENV
ncbi:hypothetical protein [Candidatus Entotheonella palauensis]|nr:hypothetical protein [Candidatus Entotheonella palauensis]